MKNVTKIVFQLCALIATIGLVSCSGIAGGEKPSIDIAGTYTFTFPEYKTTLTINANGTYTTIDTNYPWPGKEGTVEKIANSPNKFYNVDFIDLKPTYTDEERKTNGYNLYKITFKTEHDGKEVNVYTYCFVKKEESKISLFYAFENVEDESDKNWYIEFDSPSTSD